MLFSSFSTLFKRSSPSFYYNIMSTQCSYSSISEIPPATNEESSTEINHPKIKREFDFTLWNKRHVAFRIAYLGWNYHGMAIQEVTDNTIEARLFECFLKTKLIEDSKTCNYTRCGRTDTGVSALGQVVSLDVRSALLEGVGVLTTDRATLRKGDKSKELPYMEMLNRLLPSDIRVLAWAPVEPTFSARFNTLYRVYKYFFPLGSMDVKLMKDAARKFIGTHDFRNFCKMDIRGGVVNFERTIHGCTIEPLNKDSSSDGPYDVWECTVTGIGFLYHQIRCMMSILFLIGNKLEQPNIIDYMLDISKCPGKPQYGMAAEYPLILYDCVFEGIEWEKNDEQYKKLVIQLQEHWTKHMMQAAMIKGMLDTIQCSTHETPLIYQIAPIIKSDHKLGRSYKQIMERPTSDTFEERYEQHQAKKRKTD